MSSVSLSILVTYWLCLVGFIIVSCVGISIEKNYTNMFKNLNNLKKTIRSMKKRILRLEKLAREKSETNLPENNDDLIDEEPDNNCNSWYGWDEDGLCHDLRM
jgi:predicted PurR-regulated permease PerM